MPCTDTAGNNQDLETFKDAGGTTTIHPTAGQDHDQRLAEKSNNAADFVMRSGIESGWNYNPVPRFQEPGYSTSTTFHCESIRHT